MCVGYSINSTAVYILQSYPCRVNSEDIAARMTYMSYVWQDNDWNRRANRGRKRRRSI